MRKAITLSLLVAGLFFGSASSATAAEVPSEPSYTTVFSVQASAGVIPIAAEAVSVISTVVEEKNEARKFAPLFVAGILFVTLVIFIIIVRRARANGDETLGLRRMHQEKK